jgi:hypothetical protein
MIVLLTTKRTQNHFPQNAIPSFSTLSLQWNFGRIKVLTVLCSIFTFQWCTHKKMVYKATSYRKYVLTSSGNLDKLSGALMWWKQNIRLAVLFLYYCFYLYNKKTQNQAKTLHRLPDTVLCKSDGFIHNFRLRITK